MLSPESTEIKVNKKHFELLYKYYFPLISKISHILLMFMKCSRTQGKKRLLTHPHQYRLVEVIVQGKITFPKLAESSDTFL